MSDVPRNIERRVNSVAGVRDLDVKNIEEVDSSDDGDTYKIVFNTEEEVDENLAFFATNPNSEMGQDMFGDRVTNGVKEIKKKVLGIEDDEDQELKEIDEELAERGHPAATGEDVDYGPGAKPNFEAVMDGGYDDGQVTVRSTTDADFSPPEDFEAERQQAETTEEQTTSDDQTTEQQQPTTTQTQEVNDNMDQINNTDDIWGQIADAALEARKLEDKGHDTAAQALATEIKNDIDQYLDETE